MHFVKQEVFASVIADEYIERLIETSKKKYKLVQDILVITKSQTPVITEDSIPTLNSIINEKQTKIDAIDKLDEEFNFYFQRLKQTFKISSMDELKGRDIKGVKELQETIGNIMSVIKEISNIEKNNNMEAKRVIEDLGNEIKKVNQGKKLIIGYNPAPIVRPPSYFIDKKK